jgi:hypothetical protein
MATGQHTETLGTALALVEARLRGNDGDLAMLLDHAELRPVAAVLADLVAQLLTNATYDPIDALDALARLRPALMCAGEIPPPDAQPGG